MSNVDDLSVRCHGHGEDDQYNSGLSTISQTVPHI
jgi:hypothetical protein